MNHRIESALCALILCLVCVGCGREALDELVPVRELSYNRVERNTALVVKGDITPIFDEQLTLSGYEEQVYRVKAEEYENMVETYQLTLKQVTCGVGDMVKAGNVLVGYSSSELDGQIQEKEKEKRTAVLELEHVKRLAEIDSGTDYSGQLHSIEQQIKACDFYIEDVEEKYDEINIICERDGIVRYVNPTLYDGYVMPGSELVRVSQDNGYYQVEVDDTASFETGKAYPAGNSMAEYMLEVVELEDASNIMLDGVTEKHENKLEKQYEMLTENRIIYFKPVDTDIKMLEKNVRLETELPVLRDVCYVNQRAVIHRGDCDYVYVVDEEGKRRACSVGLGRVVGEYQIITEGLAGGEVVTLP